MVSFLILNTPVMINLNTFSANAKDSFELVQQYFLVCHQHFALILLQAVMLHFSFATACS